MTKEERLKLIKQVCEIRHSFQGFVFPVTEEDINDELSRFNTRPDRAEPDEEYLLFMDEAFEGGQ